MSESDVEMSIKTVFLTGATNYIGKEVAIEFWKQGYKVYGLDNCEKKFFYSGLLEKKGIIPIIGDIIRPETYEKYLKNAGVIIECSSGIEKSIDVVCINIIKH